MVYIDKFHFSPFKINDNVVSICNGEWIVKNEKIFKGDKEISPEIFLMNLLNMEMEDGSQKILFKPIKTIKLQFPEALQNLLSTANSNL